MRLFDLSLSLYRRSLKRLRPVHLAIHQLMTHVVIPFLEKSEGFHTMPDDPFWFRLELLTGRHEAETMRHVERLVRPGMVVLDVGAHVGYYALRCAQLVGQSGRVVAFEPHPRTFKVLSDNVRGYGNVTPVQVALAETEGTAELHDYLIMSASGSLHYDQSMIDLQRSRLAASDVAPRIAHNFPVQTFTVRTMPADACLAELSIERVDVIKMDIEGAEVSALRGLRQTIGNSPGITLIMEYNPQALKAFGFRPEEALSEVRGLGFQQMQVIENDGRL
ncbi:MAG TPA: FkbM family methyltransferase, partial [Anaerolineae bacterium]